MFIFLSWAGQMILPVHYCFYYAVIAQTLTFVRVAHILVAHTRPNLCFQWLVPVFRMSSMFWVTMEYLHFEIVLYFWTYVYILVFGIVSTT